MTTHTGREPSRTPAFRHTNQYIREVVHHPEPPPPISARFFYASPLAIDDPLSPLPPPAAGGYRNAPRPFSAYDNTALDKAWNELRRNILRYHEEKGEKPIYEEDEYPRDSSAVTQRNPVESSRNANRGFEWDSDGGRSLKEQSRTHHIQETAVNIDTSTVTGTPFIRAPSRTNISDTFRTTAASRPPVLGNDSYNWDDSTDETRGSSVGDLSAARRVEDAEAAGLSAKIPVGVSRLHEVLMPHLRMEPIYWPPLADVSDVIRGTWFYKETMLPVEVNVANMLEAGYVALKPWTETWNDELDSAVAVGALGEMKIMHRLWPDYTRKKQNSRPSTPMRTSGRNRSASMLDDLDSPEKQRERSLEEAENLVDISTGPNGQDNKAAGKSSYGRDGQKRTYASAGIVYSNAEEAHILNPKLQPSSYYGRRPLANYIRKGHKIGVHVVRGFDQRTWDKLNPPKNDSTTAKAEEGVSTSQSGAPLKRRQRSDPTIARSNGPKVTDLVLVIHGIGQKLSERVESYHFTYAMNALRREFNVELGTPAVKSHLRKDMGGLMLLPVNWRNKLSFEEGGYRDDTEDAAANRFSLKDITPNTLPSVRGIVSDVMLDIPYYLSHHQPKMIAAVIQEANRIYRLWCKNNPGFEHYGRVHLIAHSLGSVMAVDILSNQPTYADAFLIHSTEPTAPLNHFLFDTKTLFLCGSPAGFFLLLKKASLRPRRGREKPGSDPTTTSSPNIAGERGDYGCVAVDNIFNIVNPYDPVAYHINAAVDADYAAALRPAWIPSANTSWGIFRLFGSSSSSAVPASKAAAAARISSSSSTQPVRLPSSVELETHNFTREELAEKRAFLLNDHGQIDYYLRYGGGPLEIQYLTMLGAHSSYWLSRDFVRFVVVEVGREEGREGTLVGLRAAKKKGLMVEGR
ncbi:hypothetical protein EV356DRAFT_438317 [Viridothelium virens]|uniref:DDHD domain-containing protein n=1 Tax=Viridothelium virens TaxID=1048519 RepID=A0A6A6HQD7_VIRVR|nr:hypothetical protein EV356DRAFT_438317 [Viridothelium virens]